jgi:hypothetical protein
MNIIIMLSIINFVTHNSVDGIVVFGVVLGWFGEYLWPGSEVQLYSRDIDNGVRGAVPGELEFDIVDSDFEDLKKSVRKLVRTSSCLPFSAVVIVSNLRSSGGVFLSDADLRIWPVSFVHH